MRHTVSSTPSTRPAGSEDHPAGRGLPGGRRRKAATRTAALATAAIVPLALTGCVSIQLPEPANYTTVSHTVSAAVHAVELATSGDLAVRIGAEPNLTITAPDRIQGRLTVEERDGTLVLDQVGGGSWLGSIQYVLTVPMLDALVLDGSGEVEVDFAGAPTARIQVDGSGDVEATNLDVSTIDVELDGSGSVALAGRAETQRMRLGGSGDIRATDLKGREGDVELHGSGDIEVYATGTVKARLFGSGRIEVAGPATVIRTVDGSGDIVTG